MEIAIVVLLLTIGAVAGGLIVAAWNSDDKPLIEQFRDLPDTPETRARSGL
jgi:hypothetical protein